MIRLFRVFVPASVVALLISEFLLIYACYLAATLAVLRIAPQVFLVDDNGLVRLGIVSVCLFAALPQRGHFVFTQSVISASGDSPVLVGL